MPSLLLKTLTLRQLLLLSTLGRELNLSRSADLLHTTQPALSRSLAQMENALGVRLFQRTTKRMSLTAAGMSLMQHANRILAELELAEEELAGIEAGGSGEVRVGAFAAFSTELLAQALTRLRSMSPGVRFSVEVRKVDELRDALMNGQIDLMLSHAEFQIDLNAVEVHELYQERILVMVRQDHPLVRRRKLAFEEFAPYPWVLPSSDTPLRPKINRMLSVYRRAPPQGGPDIQTDSLALAYSLVRHAGMVWAIASRHAQWVARDKEVRILECKPELLSGPFCAFTLRGAKLPAITRTLIHCLRQMAQESRGVSASTGARAG